MSKHLGNTGQTQLGQMWDASFTIWVTLGELPSLSHTSFLCPQKEEMRVINKDANW